MKSIVEKIERFRPLTSYRWRFSRIGSVDQVVFRNGIDISKLSELDQKLWIALCMPTRGVALDPRTADLLDTDTDGRIRPPEILAAVKWCDSVFSDLGCLMKGTDAVALSSIRDLRILAGAKRILKNLGRPDTDVISLSDVASQEKIFANTRFNGDGIVPASSVDDPLVAAAIEDIVRVIGGKNDRSGKAGIDSAVAELFIAEANACSGWFARGETDLSVFPIGAENTVAAAEAVRAVREKVDDYFTRCRVAAFDDRAIDALNCDASVYQAFATQALSASASETTALPLSRVMANAPLALDRGINPAWTSAMKVLVEKAVEPFLKVGATMLAESDWTLIKERLSAYEDWQAAKPASQVLTLGAARIRELLSPVVQDAIVLLLKKDSALKEENAQIDKIEQMARYQRDLFKVLTNYVNFADFYGQSYAVFQAGTLYLDARACHLCIEVTDAAKHAALAGLSGAYLAYCDLHRHDGELKSIVAVITDGDSQNLSIGRNGVFYDRDGLDWSATVSRVVSNPISVREAFWLPYRKFVRMIEEQITKRAQAAEDASMNRVTQTATAVTTADQVKPPATVAPKKIELGTIALIGTAVGGISALVGGFLQALFGLGFWLPIGLLGIILLISGPSMFLAAIKLKQRNLGPILDANGWAINTRARVNSTFGAALTELAKLPPGSERSFDDPYAEKKRPWRLTMLVFLLLLSLLAFIWSVGGIAYFKRMYAEKTVTVTENTGEDVVQMPAQTL